MGFLKTFSPLGPAIWSAIANIYNIYIFLFQSYLFLDQKRMQIFDNTFFSFFVGVVFRKQVLRFSFTA